MSDLLVIRMNNVGIPARELGGCLRHYQSTARRRRETLVNGGVKGTS